MDSMKKEIDDISGRLDGIEEMMAWGMKAETRFAVGQRVVFSRAADRRNISQRTKGGARKGVVQSLNGFSMSCDSTGTSTPGAITTSFSTRYPVALDFEPPRQPREKASRAWKTEDKYSPRRDTTGRSIMRHQSRA